MRNNSFGIFVETWADFAAAGTGHLPYPEVIGALFSSKPRYSACSRMKSTQPPLKTLARFVADASAYLGQEQDLLLPDHIQPKLRQPIDYANLLDFTWDVLAELTDDNSADSEKDNLPFLLVFSDYHAGVFHKEFVTPIVDGIEENFGSGARRKLVSHLNRVDDGTPYGRFEKFAVLFFVSLAGEPGVDAVVKRGLPSKLDNDRSTPIVDAFTTRIPMEECGFKLAQMEISSDGLPRMVDSWEFYAQEQSADEPLSDSPIEATIGREGPDVILVPPTGSNWAVSRCHCHVFTQADGSYWVEDLSLNGTALQRGKETILLRHASFQLADGDVLLLAPLQESQEGTWHYVENWSNGSVLRFNIQQRQRR